MSWEQVKEIRTRLSRETGVIIKDWGGKLPIALIYPNSYYLGMSNLGIQAIYRFINDYPDAVCERVFWEPSDEEPPSASFNSSSATLSVNIQDSFRFGVRVNRSLRTSPSASLRTSLAMESQRPLTDFAVLAFSISYELDYFNVVRMLKAIGIPLYAKDRDETHPLVIAGGPCITANPLPLSPFFDCLCIGEAEAILPAMLPVLKEGSGEDRKELLKALAVLPGVYVPQYNQKTVARQWLVDLDTFPVHSAVLTRDTELGDMYLIEVQRGCKWGCRFCLVSCAYKPLRFHSLDSLVEQAKAGLKIRKRLGLVGPAVTDHPQIEELVARLHTMSAEISVSSLRIKPLPPAVLGEVIKGGTNTVALAPETGSQRLRTYIHKGINEDDILKAVEKVAGQGVKQLKLYFMIGLPTETDDDINEMTRLVTKCKAILDKHLTGSRITLTIAPFVPKAGTPFQRQGMESMAVLKRRLSQLKHQLTEKGVSVKNESLDWSEVQAVLSRGDAKLAEALAQMDKISLAEWRRAMKQAHLDIDFYAHQTWNTKQKLPWDVIESGHK